MTYFDDNSQQTLTEDFNYAQVDSDVFGVNEYDDGLLKVLECQRRVWNWVYSAPCKDLDGFVVRNIIACWVFVPELRSYSMTDIARRFGKKKQSLGRWVTDFKKEFPEITNHLQHIRNAR